MAGITEGSSGTGGGIRHPDRGRLLHRRGEPSAEVTASGPDTAKKFAFRFGIPKATEVIDTNARLRVRPVLRVVRGLHEDVEINSLLVRHPALSSDKYEAVLMVYRRMNKRRRYFYDGTSTKPVRLARKGWFAALGDKKITDHAAFTVAGFNGGQGVVMGLAELRDFIVKRFMTDNAHTKAQLWTRNYAQWAAEDNISRGFGSTRRQEEVRDSRKVGQPGVHRAGQPGQTAVADDNGADRQQGERGAALHLFGCRPADRRAAG